MSRAARRDRVRGNDPLIAEVWGGSAAGLCREYDCDKDFLCAVKRMELPIDGLGNSALSWLVPPSPP